VHALRVEAPQRAVARRLAEPAAAADARGAAFHWRARRRAAGVRLLEAKGLAGA
jgi:hypothetical protein